MRLLSRNLTSLVMGQWWGAFGWIIIKLLSILLGTEWWAKVLAFFETDIFMYGEKDP